MDSKYEHLGDGETFAQGATRNLRIRGQEWTLSAKDCEAMDALMENDFDCQRVPEALRERATRLAAMIEVVCECPGLHCPGDLTDRTLATVVRARAAMPLTLSWQDEEAVDAYVMAGYRVEGVSGSLRERAQQLASIGALLTHLPPVTASDSLIDRTLRAVQSTAMVEPAAAESGVVGRIGGFRLADMLSMAAVAVLGVSVLWPVLSSVRNQSMRGVCGSNMQAMAGAMGVYASDYRDAMPVATASVGGATWWDVGTSPERSNSANLFQLPKLRYASLAQMACPGNPAANRSCRDSGLADWGCAEEVSYSYQVMFSPQPPGWGERSSLSQPGSMVVLADKSPVIARARAKQRINPNENSPNHGGDGEWVVRSDGSAAWLESPFVGSDNIWLPCFVDDAVSVSSAKLKELGAVAGVLEITILGNEVPRRRGNTFVGP